MATKRKTLLNDFKEIIASGDLSKFEKAMSKCVPNATGGYHKYNAFGFPDISESMARWLLDYGTDINFQDSYGYTPLHHHAMRRDGVEQVGLYIQLGADVNIQSRLNGAPIHGATEHGCADTVKLLIANGADIFAKTNTLNPAGGDTALEFALARCRGADITEKIDAVEILVHSGVPITEKVREAAHRIGEGIEFFRAEFPVDRAPIIDDALRRLYLLTGVAPVARRHIHDGHSLITVTGSTWQEQYQELWDYLIPGKGACATVQGEVIRVSGRIADELLGVGGANWDKDYQKMLSAEKNYLSMGTALEQQELLELDSLISGIGKNVNCEDALRRLQQLCVQWVQRNPTPIALPAPDYRR